MYLSRCVEEKNILEDIPWRTLKYWQRTNLVLGFCKNWQQNTVLTPRLYNLSTPRGPPTLHCRNF